LSCTSMIVYHHPFFDRLAGSVLDTADGALSSAAVPRAGLGPATPPLCRCAECTADSVLSMRLAIKRLATRQITRPVTRLVPRPVTTFEPPRRLGCLAQRHKGGVGGHKPPRRTAAEPSIPSVWATTNADAKSPVRNKKRNAENFKPLL
jgi:hypothetical protein